MRPKLNLKRAGFVLSKIDEILAWEQYKEVEKEREIANTLPASDSCGESFPNWAHGLPIIWSSMESTLPLLFCMWLTSVMCPW